MNNKNDFIYKAAYFRIRRAVLHKLRGWKNRATDLQTCANQHVRKFLYEAFKALHGPQARGSLPVMSFNEILLTEKIEDAS